MAFSVPAVGLRLTPNSMFESARIRAFGNEVMDAAQGGIVELLLSSDYTPVIEPVVHPEISFEGNTYELDESGSTQWYDVFSLIYTKIWTYL
ncbi:MAG: hypothetical protein JXR84_04405 [Anaerolineae bacterium]|nr:hypothetical protein [Anaerolineae bacterium]